MNRPGNFTKAQRNNMLLSSETRLGLRITGITLNTLLLLYMYVVQSFIEMVEYIFTIPGVSVFLSVRICQDPLEGFFGQQRQRGRSNDNPNVGDFLKNTQALRVINSTCTSVRKGNCRGAQKKKGDLIVDNAPLAKRKKC